MPDTLMSRITPLIITLNEGPNIVRCLNRLRWASDILIVDSGSTDDTLALAKTFSQVRVVHHAFESFADQCNFGLTQITRDWVLSLDADYELTPELEREIRNLTDTDFAAFEARFIYCIQGRPLRASLYPPRKVLYRRDCARYVNEGHGHRVQITGPVGRLSGYVRHDDRKPLQRWFSSQQSYAFREADFLLASDRASLSRTDRLRLHAWPAPIAVFFYVLVLKGCLLDGWPGWFYVLQRTVAEIFIALELIDRRITSKSRARANE